MTNYGALYAKASRDNAPGLGRDNFDAGLAAVVAAAKYAAWDEGYDDCENDHGIKRVDIDLTENPYPKPAQ